MSFDEIVSLIIVGEIAVGKTCILSRYTSDKFKEKYISTLGIDFSIKEEKINDKIIKVKLWDTAGQEKYHTLPNAYYKKCDGVLITYDITNRESFEKIYYWIKNVKDHIDKEKNIKVVIIGNKIDLKGERKISEEEGKKIAKEYNLDYFETSAKDNIGINEAMIKIINDILNDRLKEKDGNINNKIKLEDKKTEENENGCSC